MTSASSSIVNGNVVMCSDSGYFRNIFDISVVVTNSSGSFVNLIQHAD